MPDQVWRFFHEFGGTRVKTQRPAVGVLLSDQTGSRRKEMTRNDTEGRTIVRLKGAVDRAGEFTLLRALGADGQVGSVRKCHQSF